MLASYSLVPVTTILATANWHNEYMWVELANRAPWRLGGADKVNKQLDDRDVQTSMDKVVKTDEHLTGLAKDGWQLYRKKIGLGRSYSTDKAPTFLKPTGKPAHRQLYGNF